MATILVAFVGVVVVTVAFLPLGLFCHRYLPPGARRYRPTPYNKPKRRRRDPRW